METLLIPHHATAGVRNSNQAQQRVPSSRQRGAGAVVHVDWARDSGNDSGGG